MMNKYGLTLFRSLMLMSGLLLVFQTLGEAVPKDETGRGDIGRADVTTMKGSPVTLIGPEIKVGQQAPGFLVQASDLSDVTMAQFKGKNLLIASVPSVDTPVCDAEVHRFNQEASRVSKDIAILFISMDLPFAQKRFCAGAGIKNVSVFSDHQTADFGSKYGVLIKGKRLLSRAIFIVDKNGIVRYVEYVREISSYPDYDKALKVLREIG